MATMIVKIAGRYYLKQDGLYLGARDIWVDNITEAVVYTEAAARQVLTAMKDVGVVEGVVRNSSAAAVDEPRPRAMDNAPTVTKMEAEQRAQHEAVAPRMPSEPSDEKSGQGVAFMFCILVIILGLFGFYASDPDGLAIKIWATIVLVGVLGIYALFIWAPIVLAKKRQHRHLDIVRILCLLSFFMPFLWVAAIIYAYLGPQKE